MGEPLATDIDPARLQRRIDKLSLQLDLARHFAATLDLNQLMATIFERVITALDAEAGSLWMRDRGRGDLVCRFAHGPTADKIRGARLPKGQGIVGWVVEHGEPTVVFDAKKDERFTGRIDRATKFQTHSMLCAPLITDGSAIGAIQVINKRAEGALFDEDDQEVLTGLSRLAAAAIENASRVGRMALLKEISTLFNSTLDFDKLVDTVFDKVIEVMDAEAGSFWLVNRQTGDLSCRNAVGPTRDRVVGMVLKPGQGIVGWAVENRQTAVVKDAKTDPRFAGGVDEKTGFETRSIITVPLVLKDQAIGTVQVINKKGGALFDDEDGELLTELAQAAAISIQNAWLYQSQQKVKELSAILDISKEITSTLDLDHVLSVIVNRTRDVVAYDRAAIALTNDKKETRIGAVSGEETVDEASEQNTRLRQILSAIAMGGKDVWIPEPGAETTPEVKAYLDAGPARSVYARILKDEEGLLGVLLLESAQPNFIPAPQFETLTILANQATVAIRNASLYSKVPEAGLKARFASIRDRFHAMPWWKVGAYAATVLAVAAALVFVKRPMSITGSVTVMAPHRTAVHTEVDGILERVLVHEGDEVRKGAVVAEVRKTDLLAEEADLASKIEILDREIAQMQGRARVADAQGKEIERRQAEARLGRTREKLAQTAVLAPVDGRVLTPKVEESVGKSLPRGGLVCEVADLARVRLEVSVDETDVASVLPGQWVIARLSALPSRTFRGEVIRVRPVAEEGKTGPAVFTVVTEVENPEGAVRPGMTGRARIEGRSEPLGAAFLRPIVRWARMRGW